MVALKWSMHDLYGVEPGEVFWCASDVGWVVGHSYIVYAPLLHGCTIDPLRGQAGRHARCRRLLARDRRARRRRAVHRADRLPRHQEGGPGRQAHRGTTTSRRFRTLFLAGERADPDTMQWAERMLNVPVIDHWWQTETGWAIAGNPVGLGLLPVKHGSPTVPMPGYDAARARRGAASRCRPDDRHDRDQAAAAARLPADAVEGRRALPRELPRPSSPATTRPSDAGFIDDGRLCLRHGAHRRHHQRRRPPPLDRRHGGGAGRAPGGRRMRRDRRRGRDEGPGALRLRRAESRRRPAAARDRARGRRAGARARSARSPPSRPR